MTCSTIERLEAAADGPTGVRFVGTSVTQGGLPVHVSWRQIHDEARIVGAALQARGLIPGDHVAILGPTSRALITIVRGCWLAGAASMVLPLPMRMGSLEEFVLSTRARVEHGDAKLLLIDDQFAAFYASIEGDAPIESMSAVLPGAPWLPSGDALELPTPDPDRLVILQYTSGSTSEPKGVMIPDRVLSANIDAVLPGGLDDIRRGDGVVAAAVPRHGSRRVPGAPDDEGGRARAGGAAGLHGPPRPLDGVGLGVPRHGDRRSELLLGAGHQGAAAGEGPRPVVAHARTVRGGAGRSGGRRGVRRRRRAARVRCRWCVPRVRDGRGRDRRLVPQRGRGLVCDTVDRVVLERDRVAKPVVVEDPDDLAFRARRLPYLGRPVPGLEMRIVDPDTFEERPERHVGELLIRGTSVTPGYYKRPDATAALFHDGWLCTGDLAYLVDGELVLCGRIKDVIIVGGRNVFPEDIERAVGGIPGVRAGNVIAVGVEGYKGKETVVVVAEVRRWRAGRPSDRHRDPPAADDGRRPSPHPRGLRHPAPRRGAGPAGNAAEDVVRQAAAGEVPRAVPRRDAGAWRDRAAFVVSSGTACTTRSGRSRRRGSRRRSRTRAGPR